MGDDMTKEINRKRLEDISDFIMRYATVVLGVPPTSEIDYAKNIITVKSSFSMDAEDIMFMTLLNTKFRCMSTFDADMNDIVMKFFNFAEFRK